MVEKRKPIPVEEAVKRVMEFHIEQKSEKVPLEQSYNRFLAEDLVASHDVPAFDRSPYDGFALRSVDTESASSESPIRFEVVGEIGAGYVFVAAYTMRNHPAGPAPRRRHRPAATATIPAAPATANATATGTEAAPAGIRDVGTLNTELAPFGQLRPDVPRHNIERAVLAVDPGAAVAPRSATLRAPQPRLLTRRPLRGRRRRGRGGPG